MMLNRLWKSCLRSALAGILILFAAAAAAQSPQNWQYATFITPNSALTVPVKRWIESWGPKSGTPISVEFFYQEALLKATAILPGVRDGRATLGQTTTLYHPAETPLSQIAGLPFLTQDVEASARAFNELYETNAAFRSEWDKLGVHVVSFVPISGNVIGTTFPVRSVDDLKGKKIRAAGLLSIAIEKAGANPIALPAPEIYQALERGILDGWTTNPFEVTVSLGWPKASKFYTDPGTGLFNMNVLLMNKRTWDGLPAPVRAAIEQSRDDYMRDAVRYTMEQEALACAKLFEMGGQAHMLAPAEVERLRTLVGESALQKWRADLAARGISTDAAQKFHDDYKAALAKFEKTSAYKEPPLAACEKQRRS